MVSLSQHPAQLMVNQSTNESFMYTYWDIGSLEVNHSDYRPLVSQQFGYRVCREVGTN